MAGTVFAGSVRWFRNNDIGLVVSHTILIMKICFSGLNSDSELARALSLELTTMGRECVALNENPELVVFIDWQSRDQRIVSALKDKGVQTLLLIVEPAVVIPQHGNQRNLAKYSSYYQIGRSSGSNWPQNGLDAEVAVSPLGQSRVDLACLVNSAKWSFIRGQLYWLRFAIASLDTRVEVWGRGPWDMKTTQRMMLIAKEFVRALAGGAFPSFRGLQHSLRSPRMFRGPAEDKYQVMAAYKVAIVVENSLEFLSEKLFDALIAGTIPVYVGPPPEDFGIPTDLVFFSEATLESVQRMLTRALEEDYASWLERCLDFLGKEETLAKWKPAAVVNAIAQQITLRSD